MVARSFTLIFLVQLIGSGDALTCLNQCSITGVSPAPLVVPDGKCTTAVGNACQIRMDFQYKTGEYSVTFGTSFVASFTSSIDARPSNYLGYGASYSCSDSDSCALDFAKNKLAELPGRNYNFDAISKELAPLLLQEIQPAGTPLVCADDDACADGVCKIELNTVTNAQKAKGCETLLVDIKARAGGGRSTGSFDVKCNRPKCNTLETLNKAKAIFAKYNLTGADGRVTEVDRSNHAYGLVASMIVVIGLTLFSFIAI